MSKNFIQIDINPANLWKRNYNDVTILGDAGEAIRELTKLVQEKPETGWWRANLANIKNWNAYVHKLETKTEGDLQLYQVYHQINTHTEEDAIFSIDVGDVTQTSVRHLHLNPKQMWRTSNLFATMGIGIPGALTAKLDFPDRQVWNLAGDGGFSMVMQDLATEVQYKLPIINVVFSNNQFGFIKDEQEETNSGYIGVEFMGVDFAKIAEGMGAKGYTLTRIADAKSVFDAALADIAKGETVLIDAKISGDRPIPVEALILDEKIHDQAAIAAYRERYAAEDLVPLTDYLKAEGIDPEYKAVDLGGF